MKKAFYTLMLFAVTLTACNDEQAPELSDGSAVEYHGNNAIIRIENASNIRFKDLPGTVSLDNTTPKGEIKVESSQKLDGWLEIRNEGGELRIKGKEGLPNSLVLNFHINPLDLRKFVVEGDNKVVISSTPYLENLELVTEGESELTIHGLQVRNLKSRREGKSRMLLTNELLDFKLDSVFFLANTIQIIDNKYIVYRHENRDYLLFVPQIKIRNDSVFALGYDERNPLRSYFITHTHDMINEGESYVDALGLPTLAVTSKNEGKSESKVWAIQHLNVKSEGESSMFYMGFPAVNHQQNGSSKLTRLH